MQNAIETLENNLEMPQNTPPVGISILTKNVKVKKKKKIEVWDTITLRVEPPFKKKLERLNKTSGHSMKWLILEALKNTYPEANF
jgi:hypothetical protein